MGSLSSSPKAPPQSQVVFVPQPSAAPTVPQIDDSTTGLSSSEEQSNEAVASEARKKSLLSRSRGRFGTISTSFQGFESLYGK